MSWMAMPVCDPCWDARCEKRGEAGREPARIKEPEREECCDCGEVTFSGIYVRDNTDRVPFPPIEEPEA